jgi:hypothetical protein
MMVFVARTLCVCGVEIRLDALGISLMFETGIETSLDAAA